MLAQKGHKSVIHSLNHKLTLSENFKSDQIDNDPAIQLLKKKIKF